MSDLSRGKIEMLSDKRYSTRRETDFIYREISAENDTRAAANYQLDRAVSYFIVYLVPNLHLSFFFEKIAPSTLF